MAETALPAAVRERGYAHRGNYSGGGGSWWADVTSDQISESTPELRWPACLDVYQSMPRQDAQIASVLRAVKSPILRTTWRVDGTGCDPRVTQHVASDLGLPVVGQGNDVAAIRTRDRFSWPRHLRHALLMLQYGHAVFEQVYRPVGDDGLLHLRKLGWRPPKSIMRWNIATDGGLLSIAQHAPPGAMSSTPITLPISRLVVYSNEREGANWPGLSLLRPAYKHWILKDLLIRKQAQTVDRNGLGIPTYTASDGSPEQVAKGQEIASNARSGDNSGVSLPADAKFDLVGVSGTLPDADTPIRYHDEQIARAVLAHFLNLGTQTGSWALGSTFAHFFTLSLQAVAEEVRDTATQHIVEDLVDVNYGPEEPAPRLVFDEIGSRNNAIVAAIAQLVDAKVLKPDEELEQFIRTHLGLPARSVPPKEDNP